jgi:PKD repeat protein
MVFNEAGLASTLSPPCVAREWRSALPKQHRWLHIHHLIAALVILFLVLLPASALAQDPGTAPTATRPEANDVDVIGYWLGDENGAPLPNTCTPGQEMTAYIWGGLHRTASSDRSSVILPAEIWVNDVLEHSFYDDSPASLCSLDSIAPGGDSQEIIYPPAGETFTLTCGDVVEVRNFAVSWDASASTCATAARTCAPGGTSQCDVGQYLMVETPLIANFSGGPTCLGKPTRFTNLTTGGTTPYASSWDFGDSDTSTEADPSHTYAAAGNYYVALHVTGSAVPPAQDSQTWPVSIWGNPTAAFMYTSGAQKWQYQFTNTSTGATDNACPESVPLSYLWSFGDSIASTEENPLHLFLGGQSSYNVSLTTTDACGCTNTTQQTVHFGPNAVTLRDFSAAAGGMPAVPLAAAVLALGSLAAAGAVFRKSR